MEQYEEMQKEFESFRKTFEADKYQIQTLKQTIEDQKVMMQEIEMNEQKSKEALKKLRQEKSELSKEKMSEGSYQSGMIEQMTLQNQKQMNMIAKLEKNLQSLESENSELRDMLNHHEEVTEVIEALKSENERYRAQHQELQNLFDRARENSEELRLKLEESELSPEDRQSFQQFKAHQQEIEAYLAEKYPNMSLLSITSASQLKDIIREGEIDKQKFLMGSLDNKLESAETQLKELQQSLDKSKDKEEQLDSLKKKLDEYQTKLQDKDSLINELQKKLSINPKDNKTRVVKEGWLIKKSSFFPNWKVNSSNYIKFFLITNNNF